jgi:hypothetical protein
VMAHLDLTVPYRMTKKAILRALRIVCTILVCTVVGYTQTSDIKDVQQAKQKLIIGTDVSKFLSTIAHTISVASTHNQSPTAKAVYDYFEAYTLSGDVTGTPGATVVEAIQGNPVNNAAPANSHTVLRWSGSEWIPNGTNLYDILTTSQTVAVQYNQVWVDDIGASITLNLPACNAANDGVRIEIAKAGADTYAVVIEPSGSEEFSDGNTSKTIFSQGTGISCTCRWTGSVGFWLYTNM